jgi:hypothetical protein
VFGSYKAPNFHQLLEMFSATPNSNVRPPAFPHPNLLVTTGVHVYRPTGLTSLTYCCPGIKIVSAYIKSDADNTKQMTDVNNMNTP